MHLKRQEAGKFWPIPRKGTKYVAVPSHEKANSLPLVVAVRDILELAKDKREVKEMIKSKSIAINGKPIHELNYPILLFDSLAFPPAKKFFRAILKNKKWAFEEISEKEASSRIYKVIGKKQVGKKKLQINLNGGKNLLSSEKISTGEFIVLDSSNKIIKIISIQKGTQVIAIAGKSIGTEGKVKNISEESKEKIVEIETANGLIKVNIKNLFVKS